MVRNKRSVRHASSAQPPTPASGRGTRTSSIFPYSVARPPTDFASPPVPESVKTSVFSTTPAPAAPPPDTLPRLNKADEEDEDEDEDEDETIIDPRETPLYARSDWGATTGTRTAWSRSSYPDFDDEIGQRDARPSTNVREAATTTVWSRSSYTASEDGRPDNDDDDDEVEDEGKEELEPETAGDPYTGQAPTTAWSQESYPATAAPAPPPVPKTQVVRESQIGTVATTLTALPPSYTIPLTPQGSKRSRQSVSNGGYSSALKSAGSRKPSQLVDIAEMSEGTLSPSTLNHDGGAQAENPFSPMFANAAPAEKAGPIKGTHHRDRSTLPSIVDLETLAARPRQHHEQRAQSAAPARDSLDSLEPPRFGRMGTDSPRLLTPEAQNRLGRMSVATARYSLPPSRQRGNGSRSSESDSAEGSGSGSGSRNRGRRAGAGSASGSRDTTRSIEEGSKKWYADLKNSGPVRWYRTWRPFITAGHALMAALLMTIALADDNSGLGWLIKIQAGGLATMPAHGGFGLSISGWCQLDEDE